MDLNLSNDPYESFAIFQERINNEYLNMVDEYDFVVVDGTKNIEDLQEDVRKAVSEHIDLSAYRWRSR